MRHKEKTGAELSHLEEQLRQTQAEHARHVTRQQQLFACYQAVLAEQTIQGLLQRIVDAARDLTGARIGVSGHGYRDGSFIVGASSRVGAAIPCPEGELFDVERGGVYLDLIYKDATLRLTEEEMRAHPAWWGLPEGHGLLRGLLGARLVGRHGQANGLILVSDREGGAEFTAEDEVTLGQLAAVASLALQHIEARQDAERRAGELDTIFDAMAGGVIIFDSSGVPLRANPAAVATLGFDPVGVEQAEVATRFALRRDDGRPVTLDELSVPGLRGGEHVSAEPLILTDAHGKEKFILASGAPLVDGTEVVGAVVVWRDVTERQRAEQALRDSERQQRELAESLDAERRRLAAVLDNLPVGVWVADRTGQFIQKNEEADRIWAGDAPLARSTDEYTRYVARDPDSGRVLAREDYPMSKVLATGEPQGPVEVDIDRFDGTDGAVLVSVVPINDAHGTLTGAVGINVDITDRKRAEEERERLLEENRRQRQILEDWIAAVPTGIAVVRGTEYRFELANPAYLASPGVPEGSVIGKPFAEVFPGPAGRRSLETLHHVYRSEQPVRMREYPGTPHSATAGTYWDADILPLFDPDRAVDGALILIREVTDQVRARQRIEELAARDQAVLESMSDGLVIFDLDGNLLEMNPAALRLHGFDSIQEIQKDVREFGPLFHLSHLDGTPIAVDDWPVPLIARGETYSMLQLRVHNVRTGEDAVWSYNGVPVRDPNGNVKLGLVTIRDVTHQKEIEAELQRQLVFLNQLIAEAPVGIAVVTGPDHRYEIVNPAYQAIPGVPDVPMVGHTIAEVFPDVAAQGALSMVEEVYRTRETVGVREYPASVGPGREDTHWNVYHVPLVGPQREVERVLILAQEVTDQVRARKEVERALADLAEERARLDAIIRNAPAGITVTDRFARVLFTNPVADRLYSRPVPYGKEYDSHAAMQLCQADGTPFPPRDLPLTRSALDGETISDLEMAILWPNGQRRDLLVNTAPVLGTDGEILGAVAVFQDITELKETREALRRARDELEERVQKRTRQLVERSVELELAYENLQRIEETLRRQNQDLLAMQSRLDEERSRYRELFDFAPDGYFLTDSLGSIQEVNRAGLHLLGLSETELPGQDLDRFIDPADAKALGDHLYVLATGATTAPLRWEMRLQPLGGEPIHAAVAATTSYSAAGVLQGVRWLFRDVTNEKQLQAALVQSEKLAMAGRLAASLAHEINNPLSAALGSIELVREAVADAEDPSPLLDVMYTSLSRASRIVSQLRDAHRRSGPEETQPANLNDLIETVLLLLEKTATAAGAHISWERADGLPLLPVMVDGMEQVFLNLALNAIEAVDVGGHLSVRIVHGHRPGWIGVEFANDGPRIPSHVREHLFEPFATTKERGSGLGLFISQSIVRQHYGFIDVESDKGKGTTFTVWLPTP